jgi:large subunit ribosomal protein L21
MSETTIEDVKVPTPDAPKKVKPKKPEAETTAPKIEDNYIIIEAGGHQYRVAEGDVITVNRMDVEEGASIKIDQVLLIRTPKSIDDLIVGTPYIAGASVSAKVLHHTRGDKIRVFKKRRRQQYKKTIGHRQDLTELKIGKLEQI